MTEIINNDKKITGILKKNKTVKKDSSDISSYDSDDERKIDKLTDEDIKNKALDNFVETELVEKITKYFQIDEIIKDKQKEMREMMKELKIQKELMEKYIINYLDHINEEYINISGKGKLVKSVSITKGSINKENITKSLITGLQKTNINIDNERINNLLANLLTSIEENRPKKERKYIKRTKEDRKK